MATATRRLKAPVTRAPGAGLLLVCLLLVATTGCGFHLRGSTALPPEMSVVYITGTAPWNSLVKDFTEALVVHAARVTRERAAATAVLSISSNETEQRLLSVNTAGKVLEYELRQTIIFSVTTADNRSLVEDQRVSLSRDYLYNNSDILGKEREKKVVLRTLQKNLVNLAMLRIAAAAR
ncbi:MAG: hypothetical protein PVJ66_01150 [Gammaproteobacteria bacterium]|jgi:LPS-assembly lipoprotein